MPKTQMIKVEFKSIDGDREGVILEPVSASKEIRAAFDAGLSGVTISIDDVDSFNSLVLDDKVEEALSRLGNEWVMASNSMGGADTDEAAREWATRMRACEKAQAELKKLLP